MSVTGIDLGSRTIKIIEMDGQQIVHHGLYDTVSFYRNCGIIAGGEMTVDLAGLGFKQGRVIATGYGKINVKIAGAQQIPEIQAHVFGALWQSGLKDFTLLDIGGQDTKVVQVREGQMVDFMTNDRCAASSGRYLENMASVLGISLEELSSFSEEAVELNATCAIFGETELIARIVEGHPVSHLAAGVNYSLYRRVSIMLKRLQSKSIILAGGGALNSALARIIARETGSEIYQLSQPQFNGAIGCCARA
ncbi:MAG: acyl-CoA dehydratase activase [Syntrophomonas sp.]|uniref:acyl-CoA dehydratase activase n=1 Tax=Syntrophomonas sp. TaxID=2053627 RepID=UPI002613295A|nr:acyl-CoA dehydratase activase [Syntrophomonas sp.]MDD4626151.1 acyl-CoA dehydratase activase [Syntrophomonas sp.]